MDLGFLSSVVSAPMDPCVHCPTESRREASSGAEVSPELFGPLVDHVGGWLGRLCRALPVDSLCLPRLRAAHRPCR